MTLPDGWKQGRLGELCSIEIGGTPSRGVAAYWDSAHDTSNVWVSIRDMRQRLITGSAEHISDLGVKKSNVKLQQPGTVLLSFKLSIGRVAIAAVPLFTNEAIAGLSPTGLTRDFLFHGLQGWDLLQGVDQAIKGATLNKQKLKQILFEYPESGREQAKSRRGAFYGGSGDRADRGAHRQAAAHQDRPDAGPAHLRHRRARQPPLRTDPRVQGLPARPDSGGVGHLSIGSNDSAGLSDHVRCRPAGPTGRKWRSLRPRR